MQTIDPIKLELEINLSHCRKRCEQFENAYIATLDYIKDNPKFSYEDFENIKNIFTRNFYS